MRLGVRLGSAAVLLALVQRRDQHQARLSAAHRATVEPPPGSGHAPTGAHAAALLAQRSGLTGGTRP